MSADPHSDNPMASIDGPCEWRMYGPRLQPQCRRRGRGATIAVLLEG